MSSSYMEVTRKVIKPAEPPPKSLGEIANRAFHGDNREECYCPQEHRPKWQAAAESVKREVLRVDEKKMEELDSIVAIQAVTFADYLRRSGRRAVLLAVLSHLGIKVRP